MFSNVPRAAADHAEYQEEHSHLPKQPVDVRHSGSCNYCVEAFYIIILKRGDDQDMPIPKRVVISFWFTSATLQPSRKTGRTKQCGLFKSLRDAETDSD